MKTIRLDKRTTNDIDERITRIHRDLGYTDGRIRLEDVRDLLHLDLSYYTADDPGLSDAVIHKLRIGARQVLRRPKLLLEAVRKLDLKALFLPDQKRILIDATLPDLKKRWSEAHEISHSVIPWHKDYMFGDTRLTLSPACHERIESEANFGTGRLLFAPGPFQERLCSQPLSMTQVKALADHFGNTITSTLWRCIETCDKPTFGLIGEHPRRSRDGKPLVEYFIRSEQFELQFSALSGLGLMNAIKEYCGYQRAGPLGIGEIVVTDDAGVQHIFISETFCLIHHTLTLAQYVREKVTLVAVPASIHITSAGTLG